MLTLLYTCSLRVAAVRPGPHGPFCDLLLHLLPGFPGSVVDHVKRTTLLLHRPLPGLCRCCEALSHNPHMQMKTCQDFLYSFEGVNFLSKIDALLLLQLNTVYECVTYTGLPQRLEPIRLEFPMWVSKGGSERQKIRNILRLNEPRRMEREKRRTGRQWLCSSQEVVMLSSDYRIKSYSEHH